MGSLQATAQPFPGVQPTETLATASRPPPGFVSGCNSRDKGRDGDGAGVHVTGSHARIEGNNVSLNDRGIDVDAANNLIVKNSASGNGNNYDIAVGNTVRTIVTTPAAMNAATNRNINISF